MTDKYTHATIRSIFLIWVNGGSQFSKTIGQPNEWIPAFTKACEPADPQDFGAQFVVCVNLNSQSTDVKTMPTCPKCAVLYDMAREAWDEEDLRRKQLTKAQESGTTPPCLPSTATETPNQSS